MNTLPPSWKTAFSLVEPWLGAPLTPEEGLSAMELDALNQELGRPLPALVRAWYGAVGKCERLYHPGSQLHLTPYTQLEWCSLWDDLEGEGLAGEEADYPRRLILYDENQYLYSWVVLESDSHLANPPVYIEDADGVLGSEYLLLPSTAYFSDFAAQALAFELVTSADHPLELDTPTPLADAARLFSPVADEPLVHPQELRFWFTDSILAATMDDTWFCAEALSEEARQDFESHLKGNL
ncbi:SMI1/KNR4 family protein [Armatimonas rosea]|uniref:Uncharacterized protein n=1 Tax=Armatimonas rosea TaxID=685828 RepID=A0A7W9W8K2_ARMRO|nr:SMI1/KNR4 family protein [Armatimonas rosea]MBB6051677.1 hypothetical protein [Armatimonas rosea]